MKKIILLIPLFLTFLIVSCYDNPVSVLKPTSPLKTGVFLYPDSTIVQQTSRVKLHWWGDSPNGLIVGYYFSWDNVKWTFTAKNDSLFSLQIGVSDTVYTFHVSAVDNHGNGFFDTLVSRNGINYGAEPYTDLNKNGKYDLGEPFIDIGLIDSNPAKIPMPIKNTAPTIIWDTLTVLPASSYPVMTFSWSAADIDGDESITKINIALNDTLNSQNVVALNGNTRLVTLRVKDFSTNTPETEILLNANDQTIFGTKLKGMKLNDTNRVYIQAVDLSGAKTPYVSLPKAGKTWYVKKPAGKLVIIDDYATGDASSSFYADKFNSIAGGALKDKYETWEISGTQIPFFRYNFLYTLKLFQYAFWYSDTNPSFDVAGASVDKFIASGGKICFSMLFPRTPVPEVVVLQEFLPIDSISALVPSLVTGATFSAVAGVTGNYPRLTTTTSVFSLFGLYPTPLITQSVYKNDGSFVPGYNGFYNIDKTKFFFALPLHKCDGGSGNVGALLEQIFITDFGLSK